MERSVSTLILSAERGDGQASEALFAALYRELELAAVEPAIAHVVDLKFFCGFTFAEIASLQGLSERTVQRHWDKARIFLRHALRAEMLE